MIGCLANGYVTATLTVLDTDATAADEKPRMEDFRKKGGFVHELTADQRAEWAKLVEPNQEQMVKDIGGAAGELWAAIRKGKQEFAARGGK